MNQSNSTMYHKIRGEHLTHAQQRQVERGLHPKYEPDSREWFLGKTFYFHGTRFLGVFADL